VSPDDPLLAWAVFGLLAVVAAILTAVGAMRVVRSMRVLKKRIDGYSDLPLLRGLSTTQARLEETLARLGEIEVLLDRAHAALESVDASIAALRASFRPVGITFGLVVEDVSALRAAFARRSRGTQSQGS
jgi:hypothetical protein